MNPMSPEQIANLITEDIGDNNGLVQDGLLDYRDVDNRPYMGADLGDDQDFSAVSLLARAIPENNVPDEKLVGADFKLVETYEVEENVTKEDISRAAEMLREVLERQAFESLTNVPSRQPLRQPQRQFRTVSEPSSDGIYIRTNTGYKTVQASIPQSDKVDTTQPVTRTKTVGKDVKPIALGKRRLDI